MNVSLFSFWSILYFPYMFINYDVSQNYFFKGTSIVSWEDRTPIFTYNNWYEANSTSSTAAKESVKSSVIEHLEYILSKPWPFLHSVFRIMYEWTNVQKYLMHRCWQYIFSFLFLLHLSWWLMWGSFSKPKAESGFSIWKQVCV